MVAGTLLDVGGYVLAGGKSSRMGRDKALLELAGKPLALRAVTKLRRVCADVHILSARPELEAFAPLVRDLHEGCGPMGGLEAALEHSPHEWNLFMPVDMPFLPAVFLDRWLRRVEGRGRMGMRVAMFRVDGLPQPLFSVLHREVAPFVREAMQHGRYKVSPVLESAAMELAARQGMLLEDVFFHTPWGSMDDSFAGAVDDEDELRQGLSEEQLEARHLWFENLNTAAEFAEAERHLTALDSE
jgi:molybdopterin-guanine dinucleotide biosynthesis protein A